LIRIPAQQNSIRLPWRIAPLLAILGKLKGELKIKIKNFRAECFTILNFLSFTLLTFLPTEQTEE